ncbi:hypothetical protein ABXJ76_12190 [Methylobacter sp. G7]|uniref:hypothetical protein n=1 Tax=Methylobacter sp. G7 TaxID=3230117 RepID=UPI003D8019A6
MIWVDFSFIELVFIFLAMGLLRGSVKQVFSLALMIAALPTSTDGGSADDCREQSRPPSMAVGRTGSIPLATLPPSMEVAVCMESTISLRQPE